MSAKLSTLASVTAIAAVAAAISGGTYAAFSDKDTVFDNTVDNGTIDLNLASAATGGNLAAPISVNTRQPGDTGTQQIYVSNTGDLPGTVKIDLVDLIENENGCNDPESDAEAYNGRAPSCEVTADGVGKGELDEQLMLTITGPDNANGGDADTARDVIVNNLTLAAAMGFVDNGGLTIPAGSDGARVLYEVAWSIPNVNDAPINSNNLVQSDSAQWDLEFNIVQNARQ